MGKVYGVDVSEHNGSINWQKLKAAGVTFAIIRSGYGTSHTDKWFYSNMDGAIAAGMKIGIYHFSYALSTEGAANEAAFVIKLLSKYKSKITLPVYFDFEYDTITYAAKQGVTLGKNAFNNHTVAFCEKIKSAGYKPGVYYNLDYYKKYWQESSVGGYSQWFAQYASKPGISKYDIWQKSSSWTCSGNSCKFDYNESTEAFISGTTGSGTSGTTSSGTSKKNYTIGWHKDNTGWWYADTSETYYKNCWKKINGKWYYFEEGGYMAANQVVITGGDYYFCGEDGAMVTNKDLRFGSDGRLEVVDRIMTIEDAPDYARETLQKLISKGYLKGTTEGTETVTIDMSVEQVRQMVILDRAGAFGE